VPTISSGTWSVAATLGVAQGGTNISSYAVGDIIYASGATTLSKLADVATGNVLISGGVGVAPSYGKVALGTHTTGNYVSSATANGGLTLTGTVGASLGILLPAATDALSATTSSGSGLELLASGLTLLQGCANNEVLSWNETTDVWACSSVSGVGELLVLEQRIMSPTGLELLLLPEKHNSLLYEVAPVLIPQPQPECLPFHQVPGVSLLP
jgi:hypothetical protein